MSEVRRNKIVSLSGSKRKGKREGNVKYYRRKYEASQAVLKYCLGDLSNLLNLFQMKEDNCGKN